jgi:AraC-like DNA-binding protein
MREPWRYKPVAITTMLTPEERRQVDAAGIGLYTAHHRMNLQEVVADVREDRATAIVLSVQCVQTCRRQRISDVVREVQQVPMIALLSRDTPETPRLLLKLGEDGIREIVDIRSHQGWSILRQLISRDLGDEAESAILDRMAEKLAVMNEECRNFFRSVIHESRTVSSVRELAERLRILPSTLMSRFFRAGLPAPKRYLATMRLIRAAYLFENIGFSIANVANHLDFSSPQSFGRHVRAAAGMTALEFRCRYRGTDILNRFINELITPYQATLRTFTPLSSSRTRHLLRGKRELPD